jgi:hypothetical protein
MMHGARAKNCKEGEAKESQSIPQYPKKITGGVGLLCFFASLQDIYLVLCINKVDNFYRKR